MRKKWKPWLVFALLIFFLLSIYQSNYTFQSVDYLVESPYLPNAFDDFKICVLSDIHHRDKDSYSDLLEEIWDKSPDIVVFTGDMVSSSTKDVESLMKFLSNLSEKFPLYYIYGNHEVDLARKNPTTKFFKRISEENILHLSNKQVTIMRGMKKINLAGLEEDYSYYYRPAGNTQLPVFDYLGEKEERFTILLAHSPLYYEDYKKWGADLTLSGHLHGGGWRLPFLGGVFSPEVNLFPKYDRGKFGDRSQSMIVSAGLGNSGLPFRLFNPQEVVFVTLKSLSIH